MRRFALALALLAAGCQAPSPPAETDDAASPPESLVVPVAPPALPAGAAPAGAAARNEALLDASSPFEDLAEFAMAGDAARMTSGVAACRRAAASLAGTLPTGAAARLDTLVTSLGAARASGDASAVALGAVAAYREIVDALDDRAATVPKAVALLDYAGFQTVALVHAAATAPPDWAALGRAHADAAAAWASVRPRVGAGALRDAMDTVVGGLADAVAAKHLPMARLAGQMDLDLVDLVEAHFESATAEAESR